jgi:hypothetical protein
MSIQESRRIVFGLPALREALQAHMPDIAPAVVPRGAQVRGAIIVPEPLSLRIRVMAPGASEAVEADVTAPQIGAVLIRRCKALGIPLPRHGTKALEADPGGIAMVVQVVHEPKGQSQLSVHRVSA